MDWRMQVLEIALEVCFVVPTRQPINAGRSIPLEFAECLPEQVDVDVVEERGELLLVSFPCCLPYALQSLWHGCPALHPDRAEPPRIPLGLGPSLHRLLRGLLRFVRQLRSYYGLVRLPASVHHRLRLHA